MRIFLQLDDVNVNIIATTKNWINISNSFLYDILQIQYCKKKVAKYLPSSTEKNGVVRELGIRKSSRRQQTGDSHTGGALNVVIEGAILVSILVQETERVVVAKILKLDEDVLAISLHDCVHELVDEVVVTLSGYPFVSEAYVQVIVE